MLPIIIIPAAIAALGTGVAAWSARAERREAAEREQAARERQDTRARHISAAKQLISQHQLRITPEFLVELAAGGVGSVMRTLDTTAHVPRLDQKSATVERMEREVAEIEALIDIIDGRKYP